MIPLEEARAFVLGACPPLAPRAVPLDDALGCVAATAVVATEPVPRFANSAMDGYAVRAADTAGAPRALAVVGAVMAGQTFDGRLDTGQAVRIMTGAPLPEGADAVCMLEATSTEDGGRTVWVGPEVAEGEFVRHPAEDVAVGDEVIPAGVVLSPGHLGVLADQGSLSVEVFPRPKVGVLSTGDELTSAPGPLAPGRIRDANRHTLLALVRREGWTGVDLGIVGDDETALTAVLSDAGAACDAVVTSGGVSVGDLDVVKVVLQAMSGGTMRWMQVAIKPAKPFAFGTLAGPGTPVFGLPGNPVSAMVSFELFVRPALRQMAGHPDLDRRRVRIGSPTDLWRRPDGKLHFLRASVSLGPDGSWSVVPMAAQGSHQLRAMADANALVLLPDGPGVAAGEPLDVLLTDTDRLAP